MSTTELLLSYANASAGVIQELAERDPIAAQQLLNARNAEMLCLARGTAFPADLVGLRAEILSRLS